MDISSKTVTVSVVEYIRFTTLDKTVTRLEEQVKNLQEELSRYKCGLEYYNYRDAYVDLGGEG